MALVEQFAFSLREERRGVHALLWDDKGDLARVLLITRAALSDIPIETRLISGETIRLEEFGELIRSRVAEQIQHEEPASGTGDPDLPPHPLWILFFQQAASQQAGPRLNGWRRPLAEPMGTLLVIRNADFRDFQRAAPDLASFIGPRIYDASRLMMVCSRETLSKLSRVLPEPFETILRQLPGTVPPAEELADWAPLTSSDEG
jgi:hypothetical protein